VTKVTASYQGLLCTQVEWLDVFMIKQLAVVSPAHEVSNNCATVHVLA